MPFAWLHLKNLYHTHGFKASPSIYYNIPMVLKLSSTSIPSFSCRSWRKIARKMSKNHAGRSMTRPFSAGLLANHSTCNSIWVVRASYINTFLKRFNCVNTSNYNLLNELCGRMVKTIGLTLNVLAYWLKTMKRNSYGRT